MAWSSPDPRFRVEPARRRLFGVAGLLLAQTGGAAGPDLPMGWPQSSSFYIALGLSLSILALIVVLLLARSERRRIRAGLRMIGEAATGLAEGREYSNVNAGTDRDLARLGIAFNHINAMLREDASRLEAAERRLDRILRYIEKFQAATESLAGLTGERPLQQSTVRTLVEVFEFKRANLWLLHRYVKDAQLRAPARDRPSSSEPDTQDILQKVGLLPACRSTELAGDGQASSAPHPYRGILEVAMTNSEVVCADIADSPLFRGMAPELIGQGLVSYAAVPLLVRGQMIGVIEVFNDVPPSNLDLQLLRLFASRVGSLISALHSGEEMAQSREAYEIKNLELQMANRRLQRTNSQLEEADRLKSEFLANTSHELRTPLNSILGFAQLILAGACDSEEEVMTNVKAMQESGERLLKLINEVLDLAKIEAGRLSMTLSAVDVRPVIDAAATLLRIQADAKGVSLKVETPAADLGQVRADPTKLYQILVNLIGNAVKFTERGHVTVRALAGKVPGFMTIEVEDTGIGIAPDVLSRLFQNFVQGDGSVTRRFGGTGLGLAISQKMADLQGGLLDLSSGGRGTGAVATLMLPLWSEGLESETGELLRERSGGTPVPGRTIVVVEDYLAFQDYLAELLTGRGWKVLTARTAREGLELIQEHVPAAIVLDMYLPWDEKDTSVRSGYDIVRLLGRDPELNVVPILIVTGMLRKTADRLLSQTVLNPLELYGKPLDQEAFLEAIERLTAAGKRRAKSAGAV